MIRTSVNRGRSEKMMLRKLFNWVTLTDYEIAKEEATELVVKRFSRGNVSAQNGWYMDRSQLDDLSKAADAAMERLEQRCVG